MLDGKAGAQPRQHGPLDGALLPFAPLLYVAWADGELAATEAAAIRDRLEDAGVDVRVRSAILRWLDPARPPAPQVLEALLGDVRLAAAHLAEDEQVTLVALGRALARASGVEADARTLAAVEVVEKALGVPHAETARALLVDAYLKPRTQAAPATERPDRADVERIADVIGGPHRAERRRVLERLARSDFAHMPADTPTSERRTRVLAWCRKLADEGFPAIAFPREFGGSHDIARSLVVYRALAHHDLSLFTKYGVQFGLFAGSIYQLGTRRHHERYLRDAIALTLPGCFAMTETAHGSNVRAIETSARYDAATGEFLVHTPHAGARKDYIGNAARDGRLAVVFAQLEAGDGAHGVHAFLVPLRDGAGRPLPGIRIEDCGEKVGLNGIDNGRLYFEQVRIPRDNLLDRFGAVDERGTYSSPIASPGRRFFTMLGTLVGGRIAVAGAAASAAETGLAIALRYAARRRQFGPEGGAEIPILDYLSMQRRLFPRLAAAYAVSFAFDDLIHRFGAHDTGELQEIEATAAGLKAYASEHAVATLQECREACGGQGYMAVNRLGALRADADVFTTFEGANAVLLQLVTKSLLGDYRAEFGELRPLHVVRYLAGRAAVAVTERNPIATRRTDEEHLRSADMQVSAFAYREQRLLGSLARRMKARIDRGEDAFMALNACQDHALALGRAHTERVLLERFAHAVPDGDAAGLEPLRSLFALQAIERNAAWFLEAGYMDAPKTRAIRDTVNRLCGLIRPRALTLADAFELPDAVVGAPIALTG